MSGVQQYRAAVADLEALQVQIAEQRAWAALRASDGWPILEAWLQAQLAARRATILMGEKPPEREEFLERRAEYQLLNRLLQAGREPETRIATLEKRAEALRQKAAKLKSMGQDRDFHPDAN
jgi:hypothetical protein